jgi:nucleotide-binding universal stress UspA family protein
MTIFVGTDGSEGAAAALRWGVREGELRGIPVTAVVAWDLLNQPSPETDATFDPRYDPAIALEHLDNWVETAVGSEAAAQVARQSVCDLPWRGLVTTATVSDLLVVGARGRGGFLGLRLGSVSERCLYHALSPVAVVHPEQRTAPPLRERIIVGVDGSAASLEAFSWAVREASLRRAELRAVSAWSMPLMAYSGTGTVSLGGSGPFEDAAQTILDEAIAAADLTDLVHPIEREIAAGGASSAIIDAAVEATLIVVGSRGLSHAKEIVLGSVSHQVVHHAPCPVVVIPPTRAVGGELT